MTLSEWNKLERVTASTETEAREIDKNKRKHRDGAVREGFTMPSSVRLDSCKPQKRRDGSVVT